ncbi:hypothetical protein CLF_109466 [Clonorchis sinensis]|uniref:Uncharacterized protein n=1 Tax=Clonorchis sinensis TaxID=79923 RepID=G7YJD1_CLOSI|nr:hypothetical protein CLF_109466 [Clonorchis sinensis]
MPHRLSHGVITRVALLAPYSRAGPRNIRTNRFATERLVELDVRRICQNLLLDYLRTAPPSDVNSCWNEIATSLRSAGSFACDRVLPGPLKHWISDRTVALLKSRRNIPPGPEHNLTQRIIGLQVQVSVRADREVGAFDENLFYLECADDIVLVFEEEEKAQDEALEVVERFTYLGSCITSDFGVADEVSARIYIARVVFANLFVNVVVGLIKFPNKSWLYLSEASVLNTDVMLSMMILSLYGIERESSCSKLWQAFIRSVADWQLICPIDVSSVILRCPLMVWNQDLAISARLKTNVLSTRLGLRTTVHRKPISFYYASGVGFVVLSSLLVLLIVLIRMLPMKRGGAILQSVFVLLGGTFGVVFMLLDYIRSSVWQILASNAEITFCYVAIVGCLSFVFFYWFHLPETLVFKYPRTKIIMKYILRIVGALVITSAIYLPFTEHELLTGLAYYASSYVSNKVASESPVTRILEYTSPKLARVIIVMAVVLFVEFMEWVQQTVWKPSPRKRRSINGYPEVVKSSPGSPWASSSPFQYHSPYATAKLQTPRSVGFPSASRTASLHKGPGFVRNTEYNNSSFRPSRSGYGEPSYRKIPREEILTDDESD